MENVIRCFDSLALLVSPELLEFLRSKTRTYGSGVSGAMFGAGVWVWLDAVAVSSSKVPFSQVCGAGRGGVSSLCVVMEKSLQAARTCGMKLQACSLKAGGVCLFTSTVWCCIGMCGMLHDGRWAPLTWVSPITPRSTSRAGSPFWLCS